MARLRFQFICLLAQLCFSSALIWVHAFHSEFDTEGLVHGLPLRVTVHRSLCTPRQVGWTFRAPSARADLLPCTYRLPSARLGLLPWPRKTLAACKSRDLHVQGCAPTDSLGPIRLKCDFRPQFIKRRCSSGGCKDRASASTALNPQEGFRKIAAGRHQEGTSGRKASGRYLRKS